jgi:uncharacterized protein
VEVTRIEDGTFYADITLSTPSGQLVLDARPSDAVALAVRTGALLFAADEMFVEAGISAEIVEPHTDDEKVDEFKKFLEEVDPEDFQG